MKSIQRTPQITPLAALALLVAAPFASADEERQRLLQAAVKSRDALVLGTGHGGDAWGCFISKDGLAVFGLMGLSRPEPPKQWVTTDLTKLPRPGIRYVSKEFGFAIAKFAHDPKVWTEPSFKPVEVGLQVAILSPDFTWAYAAGPVRSTISTYSPNYREPRYVPAFTIGAGLPAAAKNTPFEGYPVIDAAGKLRGMFESTRTVGSQTFLFARSAEHLAAGIAAAKQPGKTIPLPLPDGQNPFDPASWNPNYRLALNALQRKDHGLAIEFIKAALLKHPESVLLHHLHFVTANLGDRIDDLPALVEKTRPSEGTDAARFVAYYLDLAKTARRTGDRKGVGAALLKALEIAPKGAAQSAFDAEVAFEYARWLRQDEKEAEALPYLRKASDAEPDHLIYLEQLRNLLEALKMPDDARKITERIDEVEELYRSTVSTQLRPNKK